MFDDGTASFASKPKATDHVEFMWNVQVGEFCVQGTARPRCDHACAKDRVVPYPGNWQTAIGVAAKVDEKIASSEKLVRDLCCISEVSCEMLGHPKRAAAPNVHGANETGAVVHLKSERGIRKAYILLAHVSGDRWVCHESNSRAICKDTEEPFADKDVKVTDIARNRLDQPTAGQNVPDHNFLSPETP